MEGVLLLSALGRQASSHSYTIRYDLVFPPPLLITAPHLTCKHTHIPAPFLFFFFFGYPGSSLPCKELVAPGHGES